MPNLQNFRWYRDGSVNVSSFPRFRIEGQVEDVDPGTGALVVTHDFTGASRLTFPNDVRTWSDADRERLLDAIAMLMIDVASGGALGQ